MGYYIDLIFDTGSVLDWKAAVQKLCAADAVVMPWEEYDPDFLKMHPDRCERLVQLGAPLLPFILVNKDATKGDWATIRLSWATGRGFVSIMQRILAFAARASCRVYDGQQEEYITEENLASIELGFSKSARQIIGIFGQVSAQTSPTNALTGQHDPDSPRLKPKGHANDQNASKL